MVAVMGGVVGELGEFVVDGEHDSVVFDAGAVSVEMLEGALHRSIEQQQS